MPPSRQRVTLCVWRSIPPCGLLDDAVVGGQAVVQGAGIARSISERTEWKGPNGGLQNHECRLRERLQAEGLLTLPALRNLGVRGLRQVDLLFSIPSAITVLY